MAKSVIVGVDGSAHSLAALRWAARSASAHSAVLRAVAVWTPLPWHAIPESLRRALEATQPRSASAAGFVLRSAVQRSGVDPATVETLVAEGAPGPALVEASADADLLVVGVTGTASERGTVESSLGSTAEYVTRRASCPAVTVKHSAVTGADIPVRVNRRSRSTPVPPHPVSRHVADVRQG